MNDPKSGKERVDSYWLALGEFIHAFSQLEHAQILTLIHVSGLEDEVAKAAFSGQKSKAALQTLKRIRAAKGIGPHELLDRAITQIGLLADARNDIVHYGARLSHESDEFWITNDHVVTKDRLVSRPVSALILQDMIADIQTANRCLMSFRLDTQPDHIKRMTPRSSQSMLREAARSPWRYKPPQLRANQNQRQNSPKGHSRPHSTSHE